MGKCTACCAPAVTLPAAPLMPMLGHPCRTPAVQTALQDSSRHSMRVDSPLLRESYQTSKSRASQSTLRCMHDSCWHLLHSMQFCTHSYLSAAAAKQLNCTTMPTFEVHFGVWQSCDQVLPPLLVLQARSEQTSACLNCRSKSNSVAGQLSLPPLREHAWFSTLSLHASMPLVVQSAPAGPAQLLLRPPCCCQPHPQEQILCDQAIHSLQSLNLQ
jgi:hypothetical protein